MSQSSFIPFESNRDGFIPFRSESKGAKTKGIASRQTAEEEAISSQEARDVFGGILSSVYGALRPSFVGPQEQLEKVLPRLKEGTPLRPIEESELAKKLGVEGEPITSFGRILKRGGKEGLLGAVLGPEAAASSAIGGAAGQTTEELTKSKLAGNIVDALGTLGSAGLVGKGAKFAKGFEEIGPTVENLKLSPDTVATLTLDEAAVKGLGIAGGSKKGLSRFAKKVDNEVSRAYNILHRRAKQYGSLSSRDKTTLVKSTENLINELKTEGPALTSDGEKAVKFAEKNLETFRKDPTYSQLVKWNRNINLEQQKLDQPYLEAFKDLIAPPLENVEAGLGRDLKNLNRLYPNKVALEIAARPSSKGLQGLEFVAKLGGALGLAAAGHPYLGALEFISPTIARKAIQYSGRSPKIQQFLRNIRAAVTSNNPKKQQILEDNLAKEIRRLESKK